MFFINPWLLLGLAATAIPVIIHLTGRRRYRTMPWAAMDFLLASHRETARRLKLLQLLLLATRVGILALLALALARPTLSGESWLASFGKGNRAVCVVVDSSFSMGYRPEKQTLFEEARKLAGTIAASLSAGDTFSLILGDQRTHVLLRNDSRRAVIDRTLEEARISSRTTDLYPAVREGIRVLSESSEVNRGLYILTDGCANTWGNDSGRNWQALAELVNQQPNPPAITLILLGRPDAANVAVTDITFNHRIFTAPRIASVDVTAERWGGNTDEDCTIAISVDGEERGTVVAPWSGSTGFGRARATFHFRIDKPGSHHGHVRIREDRLPIDDRRYFALSARQSIPVLCVDGDPADAPEASETFFLGTALAPQGVGPGANPIDLTVAPLAGLSSLSLEDFEVIILANVGELSNGLAEQLKDRVSEGAGLIILPGDRVYPDAYRALLGRNLMPADMQDPVGTPGSEQSALTLGRPNRRHPAMSWLRESQLPELARVWVYRSFPLVIPEAETSATVLIWFSSGAPAIVESEYALGRVVLFAFPADTDWTNLPARPLYLPLLHSLVYHLVDGGSQTAHLRVGETFSLRWPPGKDLPPVRRMDGALLGRMVPGEGGWAAFSQTDEPGLFLVPAAEGSPAFAVNVDTSESEVTALSPARVTELLSGLPVTIRSPGEGVDPTVSAHGPVEVWPIVLAAALLLSLLELLIARQFDLPGASAQTSS